MKTRPSTLSVDFIKDLLAVTGSGKAKSFADIRDHALIRVLAEGLRRTEIAQMQMDDLPADLVLQPVIRVVPLKGARADDQGRLVPLSVATARALVAYLRARRYHRAQGSTVATAHPLITAGMTRESLYVLASRAREKTTFYITTCDLAFDEDDRTDWARTSPDSYAAREILLNILATETVPLSATETITAAQDEAGSQATLVPATSTPPAIRRNAATRMLPFRYLVTRPVRPPGRPGLVRGRPATPWRRSQRLGSRPPTRHGRSSARAWHCRKPRRSLGLETRWLPDRQ